MLKPALLIALALAVAVLAGCGGGSAGTTGSASGPARKSSNSPEATEPAKPAHGAVGEVRMVGHGSGWAIADGELLWTEDEGREWSSITPPGGERVGIDFLDGHHGWVATRGSEGPNEHLSICFTPDGGADWSKATVHGGGGHNLFIGGVSFSFSDHAHGWALLSPPHSMGVEPPGTLFRTIDGGRVWNRVGPSPVSGTIEFTSSREGWNLSDSTATGLFRTTDGGRHWRRVRVHVPAADRGEGRPEYALPLRLGDGHLVFPVNLHREEPNGGEQDLIALYQQSSAGWYRVAQTPLKGSVGGGLIGSVSLRPPDGIVIRDPGAPRPILLELSGSRPRRSTLAAEGLPANTFLGFGDAQSGAATYVGGECAACEKSDDAFFTSDGGRTWTKRAVYASDRAAGRLRTGPGGFVEAEMVRGEEGWTRTLAGVNWTTDGGRSWRSITPPLPEPGWLHTVYFSDPRHGWAFAEEGGEEGATRPVFFTTVDGGHSWRRSPVTIKDLILQAADVSFGPLGDGRVFALVRMSGDTASNFGFLLYSGDVGRSWHLIGQRPMTGPPQAGRIAFDSRRDGWLASGFPGPRLWRTHDGGRHWSEFNLPEPPLGKIEGHVFMAPRIDARGHGLLPAIFEASGGRATAAVVYATRDFGRHWHPIVVRPIRKAGGYIEPSDYFAQPDPEVVLLFDPDDRTILTIGPGGVESRRIAHGLPILSGLNFSDRRHGFALYPFGHDPRLLVTVDGGATWTRVSEPATP